MPTVHVAMVGVNRSLSHTVASIDREIVRPLQKSRIFSSSFSATLITPPGGVIDNPRSEEEGDIQWVIPEPVASWQTTRLSMDDYVTTIDMAPVTAGNLTANWIDPATTYRNLRTFLTALATAYTDQVEPSTPNFVVFVRPDLTIEGRLWLRSRLLVMAVARAFRPKIAWVPGWGRHRGINDRLALLTDSAAEDYFTRGDQADEFFASGSELNSEKFLAHVLRDTLVFDSIYTPMKRVRLGGVVEENDEALTSDSAVEKRSKRLRTRIRRILRRLMRLRA